MGGGDFSTAELTALRQAAMALILSARRNGALYPKAIESALRRIDTVLSCPISAGGSPKSVGAEQSDVEWLDARTAAGLLRISSRRVRQLAPQLGGELWSGRWRFPRDTVEEHASGRRRILADGC